MPCWRRRRQRRSRRAGRRGGGSTPGPGGHGHCRCRGRAGGGRRRSGGTDRSRRAGLLPQRTKPQSGSWRKRERKPDQPPRSGGRAGRGGSRRQYHQRTRPADGGAEEKAAAAAENRVKLTMDTGALDNRIRLLTEMEKDYEGFNKAVKLVCQAQNHLRGIHGPWQA